MAMKRVMEVTTPLGDDLLFHRLFAREEVGRLSELQLDLLSLKNDINLDDVLGKSITVKLQLPEGKIRHFNGYVTRFAQAGMHGRYHSYRATLQPWLWFLTRTADCRIFQDKTVPDIIEEVFADHSAAEFKNELTDTYTKWEYCVQYRETDFNFVSRLMEQEGIYYYFTHDDGRHTMVLADSASGHSPFPEYDKIPFFGPDKLKRPEEDHLSEWIFSREIQPGAYTITDYDFERPSVDLLTKKEVSRKHGESDSEMFDYPGEYVQKSDGDQYVQTRLDEFQTQYELATGKGNSRGLAAGCLFKLTGHERDDQNREYLVLSATHNLEFSDYESMESGGAHYSCGFTVLNSKQQFRSQRLTPKPVVQGPQTAIVVGPSGDEIYTDKYGRVKVQFYWDRYGKKDENSSCWVRVSHPWAGKNWGFVAIPRIGQEVIVDFLEGDPDQPIITGRVYNAEQMPPYALPANMTQSGMLSRSSKDGTGANANEFRFEDKKGEELVYLHAEKDQDISVENDETHTVGKNLVINAGESITIETGSATISMKSDGTIAIKGMKITVEASDSIEHKALDITSEATTKNVVKGAMVDVDASGVNTIKGATVKIN